MRRLLIDAEKCSGCRLCEMVCSFYHNKRFSSKLSRVTLIKDDKYGFDYPVFCQRCSHCPSVDACPIGALKRTESGVIEANQDDCIGCGKCIEVCSFSAVKLDENNKPIFCDLCGGEVVCAVRCPTKAIVHTDSEESGKSHDEVLSELLERWGIID